MNTFAAFTVSVLCFTTAYSQTGKTKSITAIIHQPASSFQSYRYRELPVGAVKPGGKGDGWEETPYWLESNAVPITLVPYGCTKVRIVAFPVVK